VAALTPASIRCDAEHFDRIVENLLSNAVKYTNSGSIELSATTDDITFELYIRDTGIGIPQKHAENLFDRFYRCDNSTRTVGSGFGLSFARSLCQLNSGELSYRKNSPRGSIFQVRLPVANTAPSPERCISPTAIDGILVLDDDSAVCRTHVRYARELSAEVFGATSPDEARSLLKIHKPQLVITDADLRGQSADCLFSELNLVDSNTRFIIVSGSAQPAYQGIAARHQVKVLVKPVSREVLQRCVSEIFVL
jgi:CheY-like chemotaxis protein